VNAKRFNKIIHTTFFEISLSRISTYKMIFRVHPGWFPVNRYDRPHSLL